MRKAVLTFFVCLMVPLAAFAFPERYVKGAHYEELPGKKAEKPVVTEAFSIYCPACFRWESSAIGPLKERLAKKNVEFRQIHVSFMGKYASQISQALAITQGTDKYAKVKEALFQPIQVDRIGDWKSDEQFFATLEKGGLSKREWALGLNAPAVRERMSEWKAAEKTFSAVPGFVVNDKYLIKVSSITSFDQFYSLVDYLLEK